MFRHTGLDSFGVTLPEANYMGDDSPIVTAASGIRRQNMALGTVAVGQESEVTNPKSKWLRQALHHQVPIIATRVVARHSADYLIA
jgi:hypothetical protein